MNHTGDSLGHEGHRSERVRPLSLRFLPESQSQDRPARNTPIEAPQPHEEPARARDSQHSTWPFAAFAVLLVVAPFLWMGSTGQLPSIGQVKAWMSALQLETTTSTGAEPQSSGLEDDSSRDAPAGILVDNSNHRPFRRDWLARDRQFSNLAAKSEREIVRLLASVQTRIRHAASAELRARGWSAQHIQLAADVAGSGEAEQIEMVQDITRHPQLNPRPWLLWMAQEGRPGVRIAALTHLIQLGDPEDLEQLQQLLESERDLQVREAISKILENANGLDVIAAN